MKTLEEIIDTDLLREARRIYNNDLMPHCNETYAAWEYTANAAGFIGASIIVGAFIIGKCILESQRTR